MSGSLVGAGSLARKWRAVILQKIRETAVDREARMVDQLQIDLKALLVEKPDCDAGTVQQLRNGLAQGGTQYRSLRDVTDVLKKKLETTAAGAAAKRWHLKLGIALFFLGYVSEALEHLRQAEGALASYYLGRVLVSRQEYD